MASTGRNPARKRGLQYLRARYYDASTGRFGVQDSYLGQISDPLSLNRYLYCLSDPLNWRDSTGHRRENIILDALRSGRSLQSALDEKLAYYGDSAAKARLSKNQANAQKLLGKAKHKCLLSTSKIYDLLRSGASASAVLQARKEAEWRRLEVWKVYCQNASYLRNTKLDGIYAEPLVYIRNELMMQQAHDTLRVLGIMLAPVPYVGGVITAVDIGLYIYEANYDGAAGSVADGITAKTITDIVLVTLRSV